MSQSKRHSAIETATNTAVGFVGSYFITLACLHTPGNLATQTLYATLGCTAWSLLRGYFLRRWFNHLHVKRVAKEAGMEVRAVETPPKAITCKHLYVVGFGCMGDAVVCCKCGVDKYPEAAPGYKTALRLGRVIAEEHDNYEYFYEKAQQARAKNLRVV